MKNGICAAAAASLLVVLATSPVPASAAGADVAPAAAIATPAATASPDWLTEINAYRTASGLNPVTNQPIWEQGLRNHFTYLTNTPKSYFTGDYENVHIENPQSPYYTADGAQEGARSNLTSSSVPTTPVQDIDGWLAAPFHAIGMLRPNLTQVAYASDPGHLNAGLDTSGQDSSMPARTSPVLFPGPDMTTNLTRYGGGEVPDIMETCGPGFSASPGLPLILLLPGAPSKDLAASVSGPDGSVQSTGNGQLCVVDENTFRTSDTVYGSTGLQILQGDHAVLLITKLPYAVGRSTVGVSQTGSAPISWAFTVSPTGPVTATSSTTTLHVATGAQTVLANLTVTNPSGTGFTTVYPCSQVRPLASTNNYTAGQTTPNAVVVRSDDAGNVCIFASSAADLIWDQVSESTTLPAHSPTRLLDTRNGDRPAASSTQTLHVATGAQTVLANLTVTNPSGTGFTTVYPCSQVRPLASTNNYTAGQTTPNAVAVRSDDAGNVCIFTSAAADLIWDQVSESTTLPAHSPTRLLDTRNGDRPAASSTQTLHVATGAQTVLANLTVTNPSGTGFTTVYPCSQVRPLASTNNYTAGQTTPNAVAVRSDDAGNVCIFTSATADLIWDQVSESDTLPAHSPTRLLDTRGS